MIFLPREIQICLMRTYSSSGTTTNSRVSQIQVAEMSIMTIFVNKNLPKGLKSFGLLIHRLLYVFKKNPMEVEMLQSRFRPTNNFWFSDIFCLCTLSILETTEYRQFCKTYAGTAYYTQRMIKLCTKYY